MPQRRSAPAEPLAPRPQNWYQIGDLVAIYAIPLDKYGRALPGAPMWTIIPRWAKQLYRELALLGGKSGNLWCSYEYIATQLMQVTPERARQQILALENWGFIEKQNRPRPTGWFDSNRYGLINPLSPLHALAVVVRTKRRSDPYQVIRISQQLADLPEFRWPRRGERPQIQPRPEPVPPANQTPAPAIRLPGVYRKMAEAYGLVDPRWQHEAWRRFKEAERKKRIRKPGAFWRGVVNNVLAEIQASMDDGHTAEPPTPYNPPVSPQQSGKILSMTDEERNRRHTYIVTQAFRELMAGADPGRAAAEIFARPELNRYCRLTACSLEEVVHLVSEAAERLAGSG